MGRILHLNCRGALRYKYQEIVAWCNENECVVAAISETWTCHDSCRIAHRCAKVPQIPGWHWVERPRKTQGGGVGFLIRDEVTYRERSDLRTEGAEDEWIEILDEKRRESFLLCSLYIPPCDKNAMHLLSDTLKTVTSWHAKVLAMGDFNARCLSLGDSIDNSLATHFQDLIDASNLHIGNEYGVPTRKNGKEGKDSILDVSLISRALERDFSEWSVHEDFSSDHLGVSFVLRMPGVKPRKRREWKEWDFSEADWLLYRSTVEKRLRKWTREADAAPDIDNMCAGFAETLLAAAKATVPEKRLSERSKPGFSRTVQRLRSERKRAVRVKQRHDTSWIRGRIEALSRRIQEEMRKVERQRIENICKIPANTTTQGLWNIFHKVTRRPTPPVRVLKVGKTILTAEAEKAEAMNRYFSEVGADLKTDHFDEKHREEVETFVLEHDSSLGDDSGINRAFSEEEVSRQIKLLDRHKATGPDEIHNLFLIEGGPSVVSAVTRLFNESWRRGCLPRCWKEADIIPIPKHAAASEVSKFRPISLLSVVGKLMDRIVARRVTERGEMEGWFLPWQGGFRPGRGVCDQLVAFSHFVADGWRRRKTCVSAFLDASKAYDRVHRAGVIAKLIRLNVNGRALRWIADFMEQRFGRVKLGDTRSRYREFRYGLPQGSCLSPVLFNIFLRDVFVESGFDGEVEAGVYADDIRVSATGDSVDEAALQLSKILRRVWTWGRENRVRFDTESDKCGYVVFSRRVHKDPVVKFGECAPRRKLQHKCLGVIFDGGMYFAEHIAHVKAKAWRAYHAMRRIVGERWGVSTQAVVRLYEGLLRPVLEFACMVWDGASAAHKVKLRECTA